MKQYKYLNKRIILYLNNIKHLKYQNINLYYIFLCRLFTSLFKYCRELFRFKLILIIIIRKAMSLKFQNHLFKVTLCSYVSLPQPLYPLYPLYFIDLRHQNFHNFLQLFMPNLCESYSLFQFFLVHHTISSEKFL